MPRPNIVLLTVDCWRADYFFGELTPNLAKLGEDAAVFSSAYASAGWTLPSMMAMMSSVYGSALGGCRIGMATPDRQVLAERLLEEGYWTGGFTANGMCGISTGFHRGFGTFRDELRKPARTSAETPEGKRNWRRMVELGIHPAEFDVLCDAAHMTDVGLRWMEDRKTDEPFFLWIHYMDPHWPCLVPYNPNDRDEVHDAWHDRYLYFTGVLPNRGCYDPGEETRLRWERRYKKAVASADREIGRLLDYLRSRPDWNRTIVLATGDHGEELQEHGTWHHTWNQLHAEGIKVPLIVRVPGESRSRPAQPVSHLDIAPTLLDYAVAKQHPTQRPMMGKSLRPLLEGHEIESRVMFVEMLGQWNGSSYMLSIVDGDWKYIYSLDNPHQSKLFHVASDPDERNDLREQHPDLLRRFEKMRFSHTSLGMTKLMHARPLKPEEPSVRMHDAMREQMIALGYLAE